MEKELDEAKEQTGSYSGMGYGTSAASEETAKSYHGDETPEDGNDAVYNLDDDMIAVTLEPGEDDEDNNIDSK